MLEIDTCAGVAAVQTVGPSLTTHNPNRSCLRVILGEEQTAAESSVTLQPMSMVLKTDRTLRNVSASVPFKSGRVGSSGYPYYYDSQVLGPDPSL